MGKLSAGSYDLNVWLSGGYDSGVVTTFYGGPGCGKTNFCMLATVSQAKKGKKVIFIDTEGGFSTERVKQLFSSKNAVDSISNELTLEEVLSNILVLKPTNFKEQKQAFDQLLKHVKEQVSLIVVDGMTMLYRLDFADAKHNTNGNSAQNFESMQFVNAELTRQMRLLVEIARKQDVSILVTNQIYNWNNEKKMVAGDIVKYWSKCLIEMENESGKRTIYLRKHRSLPEKSMTFQIYDGGIRKRGWL